MNAQQTSPATNRRRHYRVRYRMYRQGHVVLTLPGGEKIQARLRDLSAGGLRCLLAQEHAGAVAERDFLNRMFVHFPFLDRALIFSGTIMRKHALPRRRGIELVIEFSATLSEMSRPFQAEQSWKNTLRHAHIRQHMLLARLRESPNHLHARSEAARRSKRRALHASYEDVLSGLPVDERWWFLFVLESLKKKGGASQAGLLAEYLRLCKKGLDVNRSH